MAALDLSGSLSSQVKNGVSEFLRLTDSAGLVAALPDPKTVARVCYGLVRGSFNVR